MKIFTQDGYIIENSKLKKLNLPNSFTLEKNGGLKTVFFSEKKSYGLMASRKDDCFYGSIISLENSTVLLIADSGPLTLLIDVSKTGLDTSQMLVSGSNFLATPSTTTIVF